MKARQEIVCGMAVMLNYLEAGTVNWGMANCATHEVSTRGVGLLTNEDMID